MTAFTIKNYEEGFLEDQFRIGTEVSKNWDGFGQTALERLKEVYSQEDFDPETRLYCFKGDEMAGFLTSRILPEQEENQTIAQLSVPMVLEGYEEVTDLLMKEALRVLKEKGVNIVRTYVSNRWGNIAELPTKWDYSFIRVNNYLMGQKIEKMLFEEEGDVLLYDKERDLKELVAIFKTDLGMTEEQAIQNMETIDAYEHLIGHYVIREDNKIVARTYASKDPENPEAYVGYIYFTDEKYRRQLLSKIVRECKEREIKELKAILFGGMVEKKNEYDELGFEELGKSLIYEKKL